MQRIKSIDLARGFTVLMIAPIHTVMLYSKLSVRDTLMAKLLAFIAEGPGAQLFMLLMGVLFALAPQKRFLMTYKRVFYLFHGAILLNIIKFVIPHFLGWTPPALLNDLNIAPGLQGYIHLALIGDILQFAAISTLVLYFVNQLPYAKYFSVLLAAIICLLSPFGWDLHSHNLSLDYLLQLVGGQPPHVFFPLLPWLVYPLVGLSLGIQLRNIDEHQHAFWLCRDMGWVLIIFGSVLQYFFPGFSNTSFYRTGYYGTMIHLGIVGVTLTVWECISENVKENQFFELLRYASRNITPIYIIQWILICWLLPIFGYHDLEFIPTLGAITFTSFLTITISFFFKKTSK
jgi:Heparan-alpha-glucosaminide N-acetyltransferase, catalytic